MPEGLKRLEAAKALSARPVKRSFSIGGHRTSISLEEPFWAALRDIALRDRVPLAQLVQKIDTARDPGSGLSSAVRVWILDYYRSTDRRDGSGAP